MKSHILGFPRIGARRELKKAVEQYWKKEITRNELEKIGKDLRLSHWQIQKQASLDFLSVGDFAWYDQVLEMATLFGVVPPRFGDPQGKVDLDTMFRMARGRAPTGQDAPPCEMTKWFDTNYHYIVPEFYPNQEFKLSSEHLFDQIKEAQAVSQSVKPVLLGPISFLWLGKVKQGSFDKLDLLPQLIKAYQDVIEKCASLGVEWLQMDEPVLVHDLPAKWQQAFGDAYKTLKSDQVKYLLTTYFGGLNENLKVAAKLPVDGIHLDLVRAPQQLTKAVDDFKHFSVVSCGVIDGRNIWRANCAEKIEIIEELQSKLGDKLWVAPSCSLLHCPVDVDIETKLDPEVKQWLAFAKQKCHEVVTVTRAIREGKDAVQLQLKENAAAVQSRQTSSKIHKKAVKDNVNAITPKMSSRANPYPTRAKAQRSHLNLPLFPTTTIGSFPQTQEIRHNRRLYKAGDIDEATYNKRIKEEIVNCIQWQEKVGLDVLVHGEAERNDMVEYFGELLDGFAFTSNGWVQSYGSRCVKPPIIYGDITRPQPMSVEWSKFAKEQAKNPMKGMLTGPVTILCWSFVRDDQTREETAKQLALVLRDEVADLETAGIDIIQIDEPAIREGLPLAKKEQAHYLDWAVNVFRITTGGAKDTTQIHTHMCYSEFNEIIDSIAALDADVITIESSRSDMELLSAFTNFDYPNEIGPGIYDIHSPRVPDTQEIVDLMLKACEKLPPERLWVNPDCGLKTRAWEEVEPALANMVSAAKQLRQQFASSGAVNA